MKKVDRLKDYNRKKERAITSSVKLIDLMGSRKSEWIRHVGMVKRNNS